MNISLYDYAPGLVWCSWKLIDNDNQPVDSANFYSISRKIQYREWFDRRPGHLFNFCYTSKGKKINRRSLKEKGVYSHNCNKLYKTKNTPPVNILPQKKK